MKYIFTPTYDDQLAHYEAFVPLWIPAGLEDDLICAMGLGTAMVSQRVME